MSLIKRKCDFCGKEYMADTRNLNRGWGLCCSKSCAAKKRERNKRDYNQLRVTINNYRRARWNEFDDDYGDTDEWLDNDQWGDEELGVHD